MKIANFRLTKRTGTGALDWRFWASVDVTTGFIFKKTESKEIAKKYSSSWYFSGTGEFTPGFHVEALVRKFEAEKGSPIEKCSV